MIFFTIYMYYALEEFDLKMESKLSGMFFTYCKSVFTKITNVNKSLHKELNQSTSEF